MLQPVPWVHLVRTAVSHVTVTTVGHVTQSTASANAHQGGLEPTANKVSKNTDVCKLEFLGFLRSHKIYMADMLIKNRHTLILNEIKFHFICQFNGNRVFRESTKVKFRYFQL